MNDLDVQDIWDGDRLGRQKDAEIIRRFLIGQLELRGRAGKPKTFVLNLDSPWGGGKTFFFEKFKRHLEAKGHICASVDAWGDDHSDDPFLAVYSAIIAELKDKIPTKILTKENSSSLTQKAGRILVAGGTAGAKHWFKKAIGEDGSEEIMAVVAESAMEGAAEVTMDMIGDAMLTQFEEQKRTFASFKSELAALTQTIFNETDKTGPIFVLIDELDRCRPDYAVTLLERVKHLFAVENIVFVVATDTKQLSHAVRGAYGSGFDGTRYLKRFFDRTYVFPEVSKGAFIEAKFEEMGLSETQFAVPFRMGPVSFLNEMFSLEDIELRDIKQMMEMLQTFVAVWEYPELPINLVALVPAVYQKHRIGVENFNAKESMKDIKFTYVAKQDSMRRHSESRSFGAILDEVLSCSRDLFDNQLPPADTWPRNFVLEERKKRKLEHIQGREEIASIILDYEQLISRLAILD